MALKIGKLLKRIVKPQTVVGKVIGAVGSLVGIGGGGAVAGLDAEFTLLVGLALAAGYLMGWSGDQIKSFIGFLNTERGKNNKE